MKNILVYILAGPVMFLFSSCLTSLHPLVTPQTVTTDDRVIGSWVSDGDTIKIEKFTESNPYKSLFQFKPLTSISDVQTVEQKREDSVMYSLGYGVSFKKDGVEYYMFAAMTRIDNKMYFDLLPVIIHDPQHEESEGYEYSKDYLPCFSMAKLEMSGNNGLTLHFLNGDFIKQQLKQGNIRIKHEKDELFDNFLVTASSQELRQFLTKYGHDERLYSKENSITLTRKG